MQKKKKEIPGITDEFIDSVNSATSDDRKAMIARIQKDIEDSETFLKTKDTIINLKEQLKQIEGPTKDAIKALKNRTKYLIQALKDQGAF
jgi:hypothetical protein